MVWVQFIKDFDFDPAHYGNRVTIVYKAGDVKNVTRECAEKAKEKGAANATKKRES